MTVFDVLKIGGEVKFPGGYVLKGDIVEGYIDCMIELAGERHSDGVYDLSPEGVRKALKDAKDHERRNPGN